MKNFISFFNNRKGLFLMVLLFCFISLFAASFLFSGKFAVKVSAGAKIWPDCGWDSCTANDVSVNSFWLGDINKNPLSSSCVPGNQVSAYVWGDFANNTGTDRYVPIIFGDIYKNDSETPEMSIGSGAGYCAASTIASGTSTIKLFSYNWICGDKIDIKNILIVWGPKDATCQDSDLKECKNFPNSKCNNTPSELSVYAPLIANFEYSGSQCINDNSIHFTDTLQLAA